MRSTASASPRPATSRGSDRKDTTAAAGVSLARLYLLRLGYLVVAVGLAVTKWPLIIMDPATLKVFYSCLVVLIVLAVIPWRYVVAQYVRKPGDRWRSDGPRAVSDDPDDARSPMRGTEQ